MNLLEFIGFRDMKSEWHSMNHDSILSQNKIVVLNFEVKRNVSAR